MPGGDPDRLRARAQRRAVLAAGQRQDLPARLRRTEPELRRRPGGAHLRSGRPHRPRDPAHPVPTEHPRQDALLRRVLRDRPDPRRRGGDPRRAGAGDRDRRGAADRGQDDPDRDRRLRADLPHDEQRPHQHRRRHGDGAARRRAARGHGVLPVPPDRRRRQGHAHHRGLPRRGWVPGEQGRRALHGALRAEREGPRQPRRGLARHRHRGPRGPGRRPRRRLRPARAQPPRLGHHRQAPARHPRDLQDLPAHRPGGEADPVFPPRTT